MLGLWSKHDKIQAWMGLKCYVEEHARKGMMVQTFLDGDGTYV
jgi:hypothetical protein